MPRMTDAIQGPKLGPYNLIRPLAKLAIAARWLAFHEVSQTTHVIYRFPVCHDNSEKRRFLSSVQAASRVIHPHILKIEQFAFDSSGSAWVVTPYIGDVEGMMSLERLLRAKAGSMAPSEAGRAIEQILDACTAAHNAKIYHGPIRMDEILVDRHGSLAIEMYGMSRLLRGYNLGNEELVRDEVRSAAEIGYQLITALRAEEPLIPAGRLVKKLDPRWDEWFGVALDPTSGFATAEEALATLLPALGRVQRRVRVSDRCWRSLGSAGDRRPPVSKLFRRIFLSSAAAVVARCARLPGVLVQLVEAGALFGGQAGPEPVVDLRLDRQRLGGAQPRTPIHRAIRPPWHRGPSRLPADRDTAGP